MRNKIMIITWKWDDLNRKKKKEDEVFVADQLHKVIRINAIRSNKAINRIINAVKRNTTDSDFLIFLHRSQHYNEDDVDLILSRLREDDQLQKTPKCFLFSKGRDYIYYNTQDGGLINDTGDFMGRGRIVRSSYENEKGEKKVKSNRPNVTVWDERTKRISVRPKYFDKVWNYYEHEFKRKIFELKEDLFRHLAHYPKDRETRNLLKLIEKKNQFLAFRIKSFCELLEDETLFEEKEEDSGISYIFDDCTKNLAEVYEKKVQDGYQSLKNFLIEKVIENKKRESIADLKRSLQEKFDNLLNAMPETTY